MASPFYDELQQHLRASDPDAIAELYHDDAEMISFEFGSKRGRDAIREQFASFFEFHGAITSVEPTRTVEEGDKLLAEFEMESDRGTFELINAFVLDGKKARLHFTNVVNGDVDASESKG